MLYMWWSEGNFVEFVLFFHCCVLPRTEPTLACWRNLAFCFVGNFKSKDNVTTFFLEVAIIDSRALLSECRAQ